MRINNKTTKQCPRLAIEEIVVSVVKEEENKEIHKLSALLNEQKEGFLQQVKKR